MKEIKECIILGKQYFYFILILCIISILNITGCGGDVSRVDKLEQQSLSVEENANEIMNQVLEILNSHDAEQLSGIFSEGVRNNVSNLSDMSMQAIEFYEGIGKIVKSEYMGTYISNNRGKKVIYGTSRYTVETENHIYLVWIVIQNKNDYDESMEGLYLLQIITEETRVDGFTWEDKNSDPGIYIQNDRADEYEEPADMLEKEKK
ncbi:MAG: DUF5104 domain-containing protein [Clostridiales bacterium]|nr:DUF5104 domain-containing protein [Roseburia sp.]MDD7635428.1 DUF5104 domain-containing protein [Clostridiales bacterium]